VDYVRAFVASDRRDGEDPMSAKKSGCGTKSSADRCGGKSAEKKAAEEKACGAMPVEIAKPVKAKKSSCRSKC
jgi:hypothetical protein